IGCASRRRSSESRRWPPRSMTTGPPGPMSAGRTTGIPGRETGGRLRFEDHEREHRVGFVRKRDMRHQAARFEQGCERLARHRDRPPASVIEDLQREQRHRTPQADTERLRESLLAGEAFGEIAGRIRLAMALLAAPAPELEKFVGAEHAARETLAPARDQGFDAREPDEVGADSDDHGEAVCVAASRIRRFISRTASRRPTNRARDTMAWPIWSSRSPARRATGWTLK